MSCIEPLDLIDRRASVLCKVEDVHFALRQDDPHANRCVTQRIDSMHRIRIMVLLQMAAFQKRIEFLNERWVTVRQAGSPGSDHRGG